MHPPFQITTISYNKKGHISKVVGTFDYTNEKSVVRYSYDSKGNVVKEKYPSQTFTHKYTYKDGKVISQYNSDWKTTAKYTYKKCWVPKKYAKRVKKQQWAIINYNGYVDDLPLTMVYYRILRSKPAEAGLFLYALFLLIQKVNLF